MNRPRAIGLALLGVCLLVFAFSFSASSVSLSEDEWAARPFCIAEPAASYPIGFTPAQIRQAYNLPSTGGEGTTIAIVDAYTAPNIQTDLTVFSAQFNLPLPTTSNFEIHQMVTPLNTDYNWAMETTLDVEWAHAIAPEAKILLVQAKSPSMTDLLAAVDWAKNQPGVVAVSMSWGNDEFVQQLQYDYHFTSNSGVTFFAASGDSGAGASWPASSVHVVSVGGTTLTLNGDGSVASEVAWSGSGGGISSYESIPSYQTTYGLTGTKRAVPDVSYNGNPNTGFAVYFNNNWIRVGGTSAGAPQWAAIYALDQSATNPNLYESAQSPAASSFFRDITSGSNGYSATVGYDYVTGLGSPLTIDFDAVTADTATNSLTLLPASVSATLNSTNRFTVTYTLNGQNRTTYTQDGTISLNTDLNTSITVSGSSTGSTTQEKWVLNANSAPVSGSNLTLYYYNLLAQSTSYAVVGGVLPQTPSLAYLTAPASAGAQSSLQTATLQLTQTAQTVWAQRGTAVSATNPVSVTQTERWVTQTANWMVQSPNQLPAQLTYYHQYLASAGYQVVGGGSVQAPNLTYLSMGVTSNLTLQTNAVNVWADADSSYTLPVYLVPSSSSERWLTSHSNGTFTSPTDLTVAYYHQFNILVSYTFDAALPSTPQFNYTYLGNLVTQQLASNPVQVWIDNTSSYLLTLPSSDSTTERWLGSAGSGVISDASALNFTFYHQYLLSVTGAQTSTQWVNSGQTVQVTVPGVFNRVGETGQRLSTYTLDNAVPVQVTPTTGSTAISVLMDAPHQLVLNTVSQYQVSLDSAASQQLASITSPTISGDSYWYDSGTQVQVTLNSLGTRTGGVGQRLSAYTVNGLSSAVATAGTVTVLSASVSSPQTISATIATQYKLTLTNGSTESVTTTPLPQDAGWYDTGTTVTVIYNYSWDATAGARQNAISYTIDQNTPTALSRQATGTFAVQVSMNQPQTVTINAKAQYQLTVTGGQDTTVTPSSPTSDTFFDAGTTLSISTDNVWADAADSKQVLTSYAIDGAQTNLSAETGTVSLPALVMDTSHEVTLASTQQFLVTFTFTDNSGIQPLTPVSLQLDLAGSVVNVPNFSIWLDSDVQFTVISVIWQDSDVAPSTLTSYTANEPQSITVNCQVFNATLIVTDGSGKPLSDAQVTITLANQTTIQAVTGTDGTVALQLIPQGTFNATITYKDTTTTVNGDASVQAVTAGVIQLPNALTMYLFVAAIVAVAVVVVIVMIIRKRTVRSS